MSEIFTSSDALLREEMQKFLVEKLIWMNQVGGKDQLDSIESVIAAFVGTAFVATNLMNDQDRDKCLRSIIMAGINRLSENCDVPTKEESREALIRAREELSPGSMRMN